MPWCALSREQVPSAIVESCVTQEIGSYSVVLSAVRPCMSAACFVRAFGSSRPLSLVLRVELSTVRVLEIGCATVRVKGGEID